VKNKLGKRIISLALVIFLLCGFGTISVFAAEDITDAFTDPNFLMAVRDILRKYDPEPILDTDVQGIAYLNVSSKDIQSLAGLEYFTELVSLRCDNNQLTELPELPSKLRFLTCNENKLTTLPKLPFGLSELYCQSNRLTSIDLTGVISLWIIVCTHNDMKDPSDVIGFELDHWVGNNHFYPQNSTQTNYILTTKYEATFQNWFLFIVCFGWIWMWF